MNDKQPKEPDLEKSIIELTKEYNPVFFEWFKSTLNLNVITSLEINTFLLNYFISLNYFPSHELVDEIYLKKKYTEEQKNELLGFREYTERMHGIYILMTLNYESKKRFKKRQTEKIINSMDYIGDFINQFFFLNTNPSHLKVNKMLERIKDFSTVDIKLSNLEFDPEYQKILKSDVILKCSKITSLLTKYMRGNMVKEAEIWIYAFPEVSQYVLLKLITQEDVLDLVNDKDFMGIITKEGDLFCVKNSNFKLCFQILEENDNSMKIYYDKLKNL